MLWSQRKHFFLFSTTPNLDQHVKKKKLKERKTHFPHNHHRRCSPMVFRLKKKKCYWTILNFERYPQSKTEQKKLKRILQCCRFYEYANQQDTSQVYQIVRIINISMVFHQNWRERSEANTVTLWIYESANKQDVSQVLSDCWKNKHLNGLSSKLNKQNKSELNTATLWSLWICLINKKQVRFTRLMLE